MGKNHGSSLVPFISGIHALRVYVNRSQHADRLLEILAANPLILTSTNEILLKVPQPKGNSLHLISRDADFNQNVSFYFDSPPLICLENAIIEINYAKIRQQLNQLKIAELSAQHQSY